MGNKNKKGGRNCFNVVSCVHPLAIGPREGETIMERENGMGLGPSASPISIFLVLFTYLVGTGFLVYTFGKRDNQSRSKH